MDRPESEGSHRFQVKPGSIRAASRPSINWFMQATPYDNLGRELPPSELIGLMTFSFDLIIPAGQTLWRRPTRATRPGRRREALSFGLRHRFPKPIGLQA
jgi:hypothetical protein